MYTKTFKKINSKFEEVTYTQEVEAIEIIKQEYENTLKEFGVSSSEIKYLMQGSNFNATMEEAAYDFGMDFEDILESDENVVDDFCQTFEDYIDY